MNTSWKTTLFGLLAGIGSGIVGAYVIDPKALASFPHWLPGLGVLLSSIGLSSLGLAARDNNKSSEQVGAGGSTPPIEPRKIFSALPFLSVLLLIGLLGFGSVVGFTGCQSTPARIAYNTVSAPAITVNAAMTAWGDYVALWHPPVAQELQVKAGFEKYQAAELAAISAAKVYADLAASGNTNSLSARVNTEIQSQTASQALADLVNLVRSFGVSLPST